MFSTDGRYQGEDERDWGASFDVADAGYRGGSDLAETIMMILYPVLELAVFLHDPPSSAGPHHSAGADSLLLAILGVALLLLSTLVRGLSGWGHLVEEGEIDPASNGKLRHRGIEVLPAYVASSSGTETATPLLSVDVEDYFQTEAFSSVAPRSTWDQYPLRVVENTNRLLDMFDAYDAKATFFIVGWVADRAPGLIREIARRGHELACHSYWHRTVYSLSPQEFRQDTKDALRAIQDAAGTNIFGYRAPTWSITRRSLWAIDILAEEGFSYDSSIYPVHHDLYGIPGAMERPYVWRTGSRQILEIPPATLSIGRTRLPAAGGGYLRILPLSYSCLAIDQLNRRNLLPVVYLHPWEIDPEQPRLQGSWKSRMRQYSGLESFEPKLIQLLARYRFVPFKDRWREVVQSAPEIPSVPEMAVAL
jgi:polysaccharide deacetylase family protein (PEP-CTERM system associated)